MTAYVGTTMSADPIHKGSRSQFDTFVENWNALSAAQRRDRAAECVRTGHRWVDVVSAGKRLYVVCRHCCRYDGDARK